jgi:hypothetical protein
VTLCALADVKTYLGITDTNSDAVLTALVANASAMCEAFCNRVFAQASYTETRNGTGKSAITLSNAPASAVAALSVDGVALSPSAGVTLPGYVFDEDTIYLRTGSYPCTFTKGAQNVVITYAAGFATIPADVAQACVELVAFKYAKRNRIDKASETLGTQQTISYSMADMPPSVKTALKPYVRWGSP